MIPVLVLAAGLGTRIRTVAGEQPKPLIGIGGGPILAHTLRWLGAAGLRDIWINLHHRPELIRAAIGDGGAFGLRVRYLHEPELLGTAGAYANLRRQPDVPGGTALVVYGDNLLRFDLTRLLDVHEASGAHCSVALFDRAKHRHTGIAGGRVELAPGGRIVGFMEGAAASTSQSGSASGLVSTGVYAVEPGVDSFIAPAGVADWGRDVFPSMLREARRLHGHVIEPEGYCLGLDTPNSYAAGLALLASGQVALA